jgi:basic membrane protein A
MKKARVLITALILALSIVLTGCGGEKTPDKQPGGEGTKTPEDKPLKVVLLVNGNLGDKSFFDSANEGMNMIKNELGAEVKTIELGYDDTKWEPALIDASEGDWDVIIVGTWQMTEKLEKIAPDYPDKKYFIFDTTVDYSKGNLNNVYSIEYKQNEGSFLAGALAAKITTSDMPLANPDKKIGFLGGMDNPVINDFLVGYIQGAKYIDKDMKVAISYIGNFNDSAKGKEMALAQYNAGVDIGFNVAGQAGLGQLDAAKEKKRYAIGVDSDQALLVKDKDPDKANLITTSVLKRVDVSLLRGAKMFKEGNAPFGKSEQLGLKEECIGLANNEYYEKIVPEAMRKEIDELSKKIMDGEIKVDTAMGMDVKKLNEIKDSVK